MRTMHEIEDSAIYGWLTKGEIDSCLNDAERRAFFETHIAIEAAIRRLAAERHTVDALLLAIKVAHEKQGCLHHH